MFYDFVLFADGGAAPPPTPPLFLKATHACHCASFDIISLFPDFFTIFMLSWSFSSWKARSTANNSIWRSYKATNTASHSPNKTKRIKTALKPFGFLRDANNASRRMSLVLVWMGTYTPSAFLSHSRGLINRTSCG